VASTQPHTLVRIWVHDYVHDVISDNSITNGSRTQVKGVCCRVVLCRYNSRFLDLAQENLERLNKLLQINEAEPSGILGFITVSKLSCCVNQLLLYRTAQLQLGMCW